MIGFMFTTILFYLFSFLTVVAAVAVISARNPVHSVLWLIFAFFNAAGLFVLLGAEMLAMLLVIVYVGAVAVLFLFVVMMLNIKTEKITKGFKAYLPLGLLLAVILFAEIVTVTTSASRIEVENEINKTQALAEINLQSKQSEIKADKKHNKKHDSKKSQKSKLNEIKNDETKSEDLIQNSEPEKTPENIERPKKLTNAKMIGNVLYTDYLLYFQGCGLILLVAMIGAIVLTLRHREGVRKQKISEQNARGNDIRLVKISSKQGAE